MIEMNRLKLFCFMLFENFINDKLSREVTYELSDNDNTCRVTCGSTELLCTHSGDDVLIISLQRGSEHVTTITYTTEGITNTLTYVPSETDDLYIAIVAMCSSLYNLALNIANDMNLVSDDMQLKMFGIEE